MQARDLLGRAVVIIGLVAGFGAVALPASVARAEQPATIQTSSATVLDVSMGDDRACALGADATISCWEIYENVLAQPPDGSFSSVSAGTGACALDHDGVASCWGDEGLPSPEGQFASVSVGPSFACGVRTDGSVACWNAMTLEGRPGPFAAVSTGGSSACAITTASELECWAPTGDEELGPPPSGTFEAVDVEWGRACAIRTGGELACWSYAGDDPVMAGTFTAVSVPCAIRTDETISCRSSDGTVTTPVDGTFKKISGSCAIRTDDTLACWAAGPRPSVTLAAQDPWRISKRLALRWEGKPALVPVTSFDVRYRRARWDGVFGAWVTLLSGSSLTSTIVSTIPGYRYCFAVRARDADGAVSRWTGAWDTDEYAGCGASPFDDRFLTRSSGWTSLADARYYLSTALRSSIHGARLTASGIRTDGVAILATTCPTCGSVDVTYGASGFGDRRRISLYSPERRDRQLIPITDEIEAARGTLTISVASSAKPVIIDGVLASFVAPPSDWVDFTDPPQPGRGGSPRAVNQVSAGGSHACAVKVDSSVACWGENATGQSSAPADKMSEVSTSPDFDGSGTSCGLRLDATILCWGDPFELTAVPSGTFLSLDGSCAIRTDETLVCWDFNGASQPLPGTFKDLSHGAGVCAIRTDATLACRTGFGLWSAADVPEGAFTAVAVAGGHACAIRIDATVACWGDDRYGGATPPAGEFIDIGAGDMHSCGIRVDGTIACWGDDHYFQSTPPAGAFTHLDVGSRFACAIRAQAGGLACWGQNKSRQAQPHPVATIQPLETVQTSKAVHLSWTATSVADVKTYEVRYRRERPGTARAPWGSWDPWTTWRTGTPAIAATFGAAPGHTYCFAVRARDADGLLSPWSSQTCTELPVDDRGLVRSGGWTAGVGAAYYDGTYLRASTLGASLTRKVSYTTGLGLIATTCPGCGKVRVSFGGRSVAVVDLSSPTRVDGVFFPIWLGDEEAGGLDEPISGTATIRVISSGKPVIIDGLAVSQPASLGSPF